MPMAELLLGKMPQPWVRTAGYFWDNDLTPEGAAVKFAYGPWFGSSPWANIASMASAAVAGSLP